MTDEPQVFLESDIYTADDTISLVRRALEEDLSKAGDLTVNALVPEGAQLKARLTAKGTGVICGLPLFGQVAAQLARRQGWGNLKVSTAVLDGTRVRAGDVVLEATGDARTMLAAERTALNLIQRLSGTSSLTRRFVDAVSGTNAKILDTRKTTPAMRGLQRHAVVAGGGVNHRSGLFDQVLIKENHIALALGRSQAAAAVARCRDVYGPDTPIEVEIESLDDLEPVMDAGADIVLLDNMPPHDLCEAVKRRADRKVALEASGGIELDTVAAVAATGVDRISVGALTHSVPALDVSLRCEPVR